MSKTPPTLYPELNTVLGELIKQLEHILSDDFVGAYLQGSFAVGDFDQDSDCDFVVVTTDALSDETVANLQQMHAEIFKLDNRWARHLEGSYFPKEILRDSAHTGEPLWYLDNGSNTLISHNHCNTLVVRWVVRDYGVTLAGPPPKTLVDPISVDALRREMMATLQNWGQDILAEPAQYNNRFYQTFIVLSYCRMLHDIIRGYPGSKRAGAEWTKTALAPSWADLIDRTWAGRPNPEVSVRQPADAEDFARTLAFVRYIMDKAAALYPEFVTSA